MSSVKAARETKNARKEVEQGIKEAEMRSGNIRL